MKATYIDTIQRIERLHRRCLETIKEELERARVRDISPVQAMILFNMGDGEMTVSELSRWGSYQGSNISYNIRKLLDLGYLDQHRGDHNRGTQYVQRTARGEEIRDVLDCLFAVQADDLLKRDLAFHVVADELDRLERFYVEGRGRSDRKAN